jgi:hypothetical protein
MSITDLSQLLANLDPADLRQRIAELDRERSALSVLLRATTARQVGRAPQREHGDTSDKEDRRGE